WAVENGLGEAVMNMAFGNSIGFTSVDTDLDWDTPMPGAIVAQLTEECDGGLLIGHTTAEAVISVNGDSASISELLALNESVLEDVYPTRAGKAAPVEAISWDKRSPAVCK